MKTTWNFPGANKNLHYDPNTELTVAIKPNMGYMPQKGNVDITGLTAGSDNYSEGRCRWLRFVRILLSTETDVANFDNDDKYSIDIYEGGSITFTAMGISGAEDADTQLHNVSFWSIDKDGSYSEHYKYG